MLSRRGCKSGINSKSKGLYAEPIGELIEQSESLVYIK
jgi:hypothetical protein